MSFNNMRSALKLGQVELYQRRDHLCRAPFSGFCLDPGGNITLCCMTSSNGRGNNISYFPSGKWTNISEINDLEDFYNSKDMEYFRISLEKKKKIDPCTICFKHEKKGAKTYRMITNDGMPITGFDEDWDTRKENKRIPIRWLELTTSNICNATCSTCNPFFSSKWNEVNDFMIKNFYSHTYGELRGKDYGIKRLTKKDLQKIEKILPNLRWLTLKGGEPFADKNNFIILKKLFDVNDKCKVSIISNFYLINKQMWEVIEKGKKQFRHIGASIDGIGKEYDWIRSNRFEIALKTMEKWYEKTGNHLGLNVYVSFHNFFSLHKIVDFFKDKEYVNNINFNNANIYDGDFSLNHIPKNLIQENLNKYFTSWKEINKKYYRKKRYDLINYEVLEKYLSTRNFDHNIDRTKSEFEFIDKMSSYRKFHLLDHCKPLKELYGTIL